MNDFASLWEAFFKNLRASECLRERISKRAAFDKQAAFRYCDRDNDGFISVQDIKQVLSENNGGSNDKEILLVINKFKQGGTADNLRRSNGTSAKDTMISLGEYLAETSPKIDIDEQQLN